MSSHEELRQIALVEFARAGYGATSIQHIAEVAGLAKSSVLYHFASKEALLEATISPAIERMRGILDQLEATELSVAGKAVFIESFTDLLLAHRLEVNMFINQGPSLHDVPVIERANQLVYRLATYFQSATSSTEDRMRFGIALGGAAYMLCTVQSLQLEHEEPTDEIRAALITIITELLSPVSVRSTVSA
jgi:TetR/AcrR family transcriptional regulator